MMIMQKINKENSTSNSHPTVLNDTDGTKPSSKQHQLQPRKYILMDLASPYYQPSTLKYRNQKPITSHDITTQKCGTGI